MIARASLLLAAILLCSCSRTQAPASALVRLAPACARERIAVTFVGDSLARGWGASAPNASFASLIYADVRRTHSNATMRNLGKPGATTDEIAAAEIHEIRSSDCALVVVISGANDVQRLYTPAHFKSSYANLLRQLRVRLPLGAVVVMGLPDVGLSPRIPWFLKPTESWLSRDGDAAIGAAAREYGAAFVPLYALSHEEAYRSKSLLSGDGIHPNDEGYRIMAGAALPSVLKVLQAPTQ